MLCFNCVTCIAFLRVLILCVYRANWIFLLPRYDCLIFILHSSLMLITSPNLSLLITNVCSFLLSIIVVCYHSIVSHIFSVCLSIISHIFSVRVSIRELVSTIFSVNSSKLSVFYGVLLKIFRLVF